ncbi:hypothetical protein Taro_034298 [Colocasia esculenta]|uniref:Seed maturation protein n=1 Tax=Colocasia esculenta TaxID=4460 RepID=A0A843W782_COLES|nr:hypothetical protein [Colocasia esculenta]
MAHGKDDDITYGAAQAKVSEDESVRVAYKHGTPLEGGKIAESDPVQLFSGAAERMSGTDTSTQPSPRAAAAAAEHGRRATATMGELTHPPPAMP